MAKITIKLTLAEAEALVKSLGQHHLDQKATTAEAKLRRAIQKQKRSTGKNEPEPQFTTGPAETPPTPIYKDRLNHNEFVVFLKALRDTKLVRLVGSCADGREGDIDMFILKGAEGMEKIIEVFDEHGVKWESNTTGSIRSPSDSKYMPTLIECSYLFGGYGYRLKKISIHSVEFKAYAIPERRKSIH